MASPDLSGPLYTAIKGATAIASALATYESQPAIFTRRPVPIDCGYPLIIAAGDITHGDQDFIDAPLSMIVRDVAIYGLKQDQYRTVETTALLVRDLFHRKRDSLIVPGWNVVDIRCAGPIVAQTDDDHSVGRIVTLTIRLSQ